MVINPTLHILTISFKIFQHYSCKSYLNQYVLTCISEQLQSGIPYVEVLCKNRYIGRSFIQPCQRSRKLAVAKKFGAITENLKGRRVVIIDDSIVRGTTVGPIIKLLKDAGAKEVCIYVITYCN